MMSVNQQDPKVVTIRVCRAEDLKFSPDYKKKKVTTKWRVVFISGSKKKCSEVVNAPNGDPRWDCEVNLKLNSRQEPISLLVMDSEEHHVGQVILPLTQIKPLPADHDPWATHKINASTLEPTKKNSYPSGCLYFWIYVAEYHLDSQTGGGLGMLKPKKFSHAGGSMQSLNALFRKTSDKPPPSGGTFDDQQQPKTKKKGRFWRKSSKGGDSALSRSMFDLSGQYASSGMSVTSDIRLGVGGDSSEEDGASSFLGGSSGIGSEGPGGGHYPHNDGDSTSCSRSLYDSPLRQGQNGSLGRAAVGCYASGSGGLRPKSSRPSLTGNTFVKNRRSGVVVREIDLDVAEQVLENDFDHKKPQQRVSSFHSNNGKSAGTHLSKTDSGVGTMGRRKHSLTDLFHGPDHQTTGSKRHSRLPSEAGSEVWNEKATSKSMWSLSKSSKNSANKKELSELNLMLRQENEDLANRLMQSNKNESSLRDQVTTLKSQLTSRERDVERLSRNLCDLKNRLLTDGFTTYLEKSPGIELSAIGKVKLSGTSIPIGSQFPVPTSDSPCFEDLPPGSWVCYTGLFDKGKVVVTNPEEAMMLHKLGCHGMLFDSKSSYSRVNTKDKRTLPRQLDQSSELEDNTEEIVAKKPRLDEDTKLFKTGSPLPPERRDISAETDSDSWGDEPWDDEEISWPKPPPPSDWSTLQAVKRPDWLLSDQSDVQEVEEPQMLLRKPVVPVQIRRLVLSDVEAFYLSHGLGCLRVLDLEKNQISLDALWRHFTRTPSTGTTFVCRYVAYLHFRARGWQVRHGLRMGVDYLLYALSPDHAHAAASVIVLATGGGPKQPVTREERRVSLMRAYARLRISGNVAKDLIACLVHLPDDFEATSPDVIRSISIKNISLARWQPIDKTKVEDVPATISSKSRKL